MECTSFLNKVAVSTLTAHAGLVRWSSRFVCTRFFGVTVKQASRTPVGGMVGKTEEFVQVLGYNGTYYPCTCESDPAANVAIHAYQCNCLHGTISKPRT